MIKKGFLTAIILLLLTFSLYGCGGSKTTGADPTKEDTTPVKLQVYITGGVAMSDLEFQHFFVEPVQKKYPYITLEAVRDQKGSAPQDLISAGTLPDIILSSNTSFNTWKNYDAIQPLDDLIKEHNVDLNQIKPVITDSIKLYADHGEMLALPFSLNFAELFYNKDIFDKFGVAYPKDLMTWDQTIELARKLTRNVDGKQYYGLDLDAPDRIGGGLSLPLVDKNDKSLINSPDWVRVMNVEKENYDIPGMVDGTTYSHRGAFMKDKTLAMIYEWADAIIPAEEDMYKTGDIMNWDIAAMPNFPEALGTGREIDIHAAMLSKTSQHKEQAFKVMNYMLSNDVQTLVSRSGRRTILQNSAELDKQFGADWESLKGKNVAAVFKTEPRKLHDNPTQFDKDIVKVSLADAAKNVAVNKMDINTALQQAAETADKKIQEAKAQK